MRKQHLQALPLALTITLALSGCSSKSLTATDEEQYGPLVNVPETTSARDSETFRRRVTQQERLHGERVSMNGVDQPLMTVLTQAVPGMQVNIIPQDMNVDLTKPIDIRAKNMTIPDFLNYVEAVSGYELELRKDNSLLVKSHVYKQFNLVPFAGDRTLQTRITTQRSITGGGASGGAGASPVAGTGGAGAGDGGSGDGNTAGTTATVTTTEDEWESILAGARSILGVSESASAEPGFDQPQFPEGLDLGRSAGNMGRPEPRDSLASFVTGSRSTGLVMAAGAPSRMRVLNDYLTNATTLATNNIRIDFKMYDVALNDRSAKGIEWDILTNLTLGGNPLTAGFTGQPSFLNGEDLWGLATSYEGGEVSTDVILNFLKRFGRTELINEPSVLVRNGATALINAGEQLSFIGDFEQAQDINGNVTQSPVIERIQVGLTLQVTARLLDDERIMLDIVPVIASISGGDDFSFEGNSWTIPRTSIQQLTTQVIARSGRPIKLGGLITEKIAKELSSLPFKNSKTGEMFSFLFDSEQNEMEKRELVMIVTPKIIEEV